MAPSPELSTNRKRSRSSTTFALACSTGAISRLNSPALPASNSSIGIDATATLSILTTGISITCLPSADNPHAHRSASDLPPFQAFFRMTEFDQCHAISPAFIAVITDLVDASRNDVRAEPRIARSVEWRRWSSRWIKGIAEVMEPDHDVIWKTFRFDIDFLIRTPVIGVFHDVACCFIDRKFERASAVLVKRSARDLRAKRVDEFPCRPKLAEVAVDFDLCPCDRQ